MATCGDFEIERAIGWGRRATFFSARASDSGGDSLLVIRRARSGERAFSQAFLRSAAEQQAAVAAGCRRLAPILAFQIDHSGFAFYATTRFETSLAEFLDAGCKVDSALLREIVTGVLGALSELQEKSRRAHGNITPGNILLDAKGHVFLTDLAPVGKDATTADDLFALGTLIYQLVRRTTNVGLLNPPLDYSPQWTDSLGDDAEGWREFTNRLLSKARNAGPSALKTAASDLKSLGSLAAKATVAPPSIAPDGTQRAARRAPPKKKTPLPKVIAIILLLAGGGGGYMWWKNKESDKKARIARELEDERIRKMKEAEPSAIRQLRVELKQPLPGEIASDSKLKPLLDRIGKSLDGSGSKNDVTSVLGNWDAPEKMKAQSATWRSAPRAWTRLAGELEAAATIDAEGETSIIAQLQKAVAARKAADGLDDVWGRITLTLKDLNATNNPLLPDFTPWAVNEILFTTRLTDGPQRAQAALEKLREVLTFQREMGPRVLWTRFEKEAASVIQIPSSDLMPAWPGKWKQEAERLVRPADEKRAEWDTVLTNAEKLIPRRPAKEQPDWQQKLVAARTAVATALETDVLTIDRMIEELKKVRDPLLDEHDKFRALLDQLQKNAKDATKEQAQAALKQFNADAAKLSSEYRAKVDTTKLASDMAAALKTPDAMKLDFGRGPDWAEVTNPDPTLAIYQLGGPDGPKVPFLPLGTTGYAMAAIETPLSVAKISGANRPALITNPGPRIRTEAFEPLEDWLWPGVVTFMQKPRPTLQIRDYFAPNVKPGEVRSMNLPVTWLSFPDATAMAKLLGGRLPTSDEWKIASKQAGPARRLRATAWADQVARVKDWQTKTNEPTQGYKPNTGSFSTQPGLSADRKYTGDDEPAFKGGAGDDGYLWLRSVFPDGGWTPQAKFYHLIGNAAEWVNDNGTAAYIGGSVVSPKSLPTEEKVSPPNQKASGPIAGTGPFFDVTFRLVVKLGPGGAGVGLTKFKELAATIQAPPPPSAQ